MLGEAGGATWAGDPAPFTRGGQECKCAQESGAHSRTSGTDSHLVLTCKLASPCGVWNSPKWFKRQGNCLALRHVPSPGTVSCRSLEFPVQGAVAVMESQEDPREDGQPAKEAGARTEKGHRVAQALR
jgi:hypothetical protein